MVKRLTEGAKVRRSFRRSFAQLGRMLPAILVRNWRNVLMPWRMLPYPIALALIGLVALGLVCTDPEPGTWQEPEPSTIGGQEIPMGLDCAEDEVIGYVGIPDTLVCVHTDKLQELFPDPDVVRANAACQAGVLETHRVLQWIVDDANAAFNYDPTEGAFARSDVRDMVLARLTELAPCVSDADAVNFNFDDGDDTLPTPAPTSTTSVAPVGDAACDDDAPPGYTWQGSMADGYTCVPFAEFTGRSGLITTAKGTVEYHTVPCGEDETALPPPYADVILCVDTAAYAAIQ